MAAGQAIPDSKCAGTIVHNLMKIQAVGRSLTTSETRTQAEMKGGRGTRHNEDPLAPVTPRVGSTVCTATSARRATASTVIPA